MRSENRAGVVASVFQFLGALSGLLAIAILIWKGGMIYHMVESHDARIQALEISGSAIAREYIKMDELRQSSVERRLQRLEDAMMVLPRLEQKIDNVQTTLEKHERANTNPVR